MTDVAMQRRGLAALTFTIRSEELDQLKFTINIVGPMRSLMTLISLFGLGLAGGPSVAAGPNVVHGLAAAGEILPFEVIRDRIVASVRGEYVGAEFDAQTRTYRFRFVDDGTVVNVDVDARTGERIKRRQRF